ncbi:hypothetical protein ACQJBY_036224 [Aegilops geniculata]
MHARRIQPTHHAPHPNPRSTAAPCFHPSPPHASSAGPSTPAGPLPQRATRPSPTAIFHATPSLAPCPARRGPFTSHLQRRAAPAGPRARPPLRLCRVRQSVSSPVGTASQDPIFHPASHLPAAARLPPSCRRVPPFPGRCAPPTSRPSRASLPQLPHASLPLPPRTVDGGVPHFIAPWLGAHLDGAVDAVVLLHRLLPVLTGWPLP